MIDTAGIGFGEPGLAALLEAVLLMVPRAYSADRSQREGAQRACVSQSVTRWLPVGGAPAGAAIGTALPLLTAAPVRPQIAA